jgi:hypothetical protein
MVTWPSSVFILKRERTCPQVQETRTGQNWEAGKLEFSKLLYDAALSSTR